jgi:metallophosphoesterase (TIGR00282 family)
MGNHTWGKKDIFKFIDHPKLIRPANYPEGVVGKGYNIYECKGKKIAVINIMGRVDINILTENPFLKVKKIIEKIQNQVDMIFIDFHAEATAEKVAMGNYLDGRVTAMFGTHTHVQTADETILPNGTAYITDIGMTGPKNSVIGMEIEASLKRFVTSIPERYRTARGDCMINGIVIEINDSTCKAEKIYRINI